MATSMVLNDMCGQCSVQEEAWGEQVATPTDGFRVIAMPPYQPAATAPSGAETAPAGSASESGAGGGRDVSSGAGSLESAGHAHHSASEAPATPSKRKREANDMEGR